MKVLHLCFRVPIKLSSSNDSTFIVYGVLYDYVKFLIFSKAIYKVKKGKKYVSSTYVKYVLYRIAQKFDGGKL